MEGRGGAGRRKVSEQRHYWIVEWSFKGENTWHLVGHEPFLTKPSADSYPHRPGYDYRIVEAWGRPVAEPETPRPCRCNASTGICGCITYGTGKLDNNGFFQFPCPHGREVHTCLAVADAAQPRKEGVVI